MRIALAVLFAVVLLVAKAHAQNLVGDWISEGKRGKIEIYACGTAGHEVLDKALLDKLCSYVKDDGPRLCGRVKEILPDGLAELKAKGKKPEDQLHQAMLCMARSQDQEWPWKGGVYQPDDGETYRLRLAPQGANKLKGSGCGLGGWVCPKKGEFVWTKSGG